MIETAKRQSWIATLAKAELLQLENQLKQLQPVPQYTFLRPPEIGLTMVRGRAGGTGKIFNLGEMTLTRCVVQLKQQPVITGFGYVAGRSQRHAELAAVCDALMQHPQWAKRVQQTVIKPLQAEATRQREVKHRQTAATQVNFFTMVRGE